jgi:hypothetical protein
MRRHARSTLLAFAASLLLPLGGCGDDVQFAAPPKRTGGSAALPAGHPGMPSGHPPTDGAAAKSGDAAASPHGAAGTSTPSPHGAGGASAVPHGEPASGAGKADPFAEDGGGAKVEASKYDPQAVAISGEISLPEGMKAPEGPFALFVNVVEGSKGRMPILAKRIDSPKFPAKFELRHGDNPTKAVVDPTKTLHVYVSISTSGDVMRATNKTHSPAPIRIGQADFKLTLNP